MRKKFKVKKRFKIKYLFYIFLIYISFVYTFYFSIQKISDNNNKKFINLILSGGNTHLLSNYKVTKIVNGTIKLFTNIESDLVIKPIYEKIEEEKKESCKNGATIVFTSLLLLGLCFIRRRKY